MQKIGKLLHQELKCACFIDITSDIYADCNSFLQLIKISSSLITSNKIIIDKVYPFGKTEFVCGNFSSILHTDRGIFSIFSLFDEFADDNIWKTFCTNPQLKFNKNMISCEFCGHLAEFYMVFDDSYSCVDCAKIITYIATNMFQKWILFREMMIIDLSKYVFSMLMNRKLYITFM